MGSVIRRPLTSLGEKNGHLRYGLTARSYVKLTDSSKLPVGCTARSRSRRVTLEGFHLGSPKADRARVEVEWAKPGRVSRVQMWGALNS